jgi:hypothetical protein
MELEGSLSCSKEDAIVPYLDPLEPSPQSQAFLLQHPFQYHLPIHDLVSHMVAYTSVQTTILYAFPISPIYYMSRLFYFP